MCCCFFQPPLAAQRIAEACGANHTIQVQQFTHIISDCMQALEGACFDEGYFFAQAPCPSHFFLLTAHLRATEKLLRSLLSLYYDLLYRFTFALDMKYVCCDHGAFCLLPMKNGRFLQKRTV
jgi:hypothetical protein